VGTALSCPPSYAKAGTARLALGNRSHGFNKRFAKAAGKVVLSQAMDTSTKISLKLRLWRWLKPLSAAGVSVS